MTSLFIFMGWKLNHFNNMDPSLPPPPAILLRVASTKTNAPSLLIPMVAEAAVTAHNNSSRFVLAVSGGSVPTMLFTPALITALSALNIPTTPSYFSTWDLILADERVVPFSDPDSNANLIHSQCSENGFTGVVFHNINYYNNATKDELISKVQQISLDYEKTLHALLPNNRNIDLCILGMGEDGHTCSLFPANMPTDLSPTDPHTHLVTPILNSPKLPPVRITLTYHALNARSNRCIFAACGGGKNEILRQVFKLGASETVSTLAKSSEQVSERNTANELKGRRAYSR